MIKKYKMQLCFLLDASLNGSQLIQQLEKLKEKGLISAYSTIEEKYLGFPYPKPGSSFVYRIDNLLLDLIYNRGLWENIPFQNLGEFIKVFYNTARKFFKTEDITRWTNELNALEDIVDVDFNPEKHEGLKNEFAYQAFSLIKDFKGYAMTRMVVVDGKLPELEQELDEKYLRRTIDV